MHKGPTTCIICYTTFSSKKLFVLHSSVHLPSSLNCETCGKPFIMLDRLRRHQVTCHPAALLCSSAQCNYCGKNFSRKSSLAKLMLVVHGASHSSKPL